MQGGVIWITGLSGVGKSALAEKLIAVLRQRSIAAILLDGDALRVALAEAGLDPESRKQLAFRYARLAALFAKQGLTVVVATISLLHSVHAFNRAQTDRYLEVLVDADPQLRTSRSRDCVGGPRVGNEIEAEFPLHPHLRLTNDASLHTLDRHVETILQFFGKIDVDLHR